MPTNPDAPPMSTPDTSRTRTPEQQHDDDVEVARREHEASQEGAALEQEEAQDRASAEQDADAARAQAQHESDADRAQADSGAATESPAAASGPQGTFVSRHRGKLGFLSGVGAAGIAGAAAGLKKGYREGEVAAHEVKSWFSLDAFKEFGRAFFGEKTKDLFGGEKTEKVEKEKEKIREGHAKEDEKAATKKK